MANENKSQNNYILDKYVKYQLPKLKTVDESDLNSMFEGFSVNKLVKNSKMTETELIETFRLSMITESLTEQYAETFIKGALDNNAIWLSNYIENFCVPDELGHMDPFKNVLFANVQFEISIFESSIKIPEPPLLPPYPSRS